MPWQVAKRESFTSTALEQGDPGPIARASKFCSQWASEFSLSIGAVSLSESVSSVNANFQRNYQFKTEDCKTSDTIS